MRLYLSEFEGKTAYCLEVYRPSDVYGFYGKWFNKARKLCIEMKFTRPKHPSTFGHYLFRFKGETDRQTVIGLIYQSKGVMDYGR